MGRKANIEGHKVRGFETQSGTDSKLIKHVLIDAMKTNLVVHIIILTC